MKISTRNVFVCLFVYLFTNQLQHLRGCSQIIYSDMGDSYRNRNTKKHSPRCHLDQVDPLVTILSDFLCECILSYCEIIAIISCICLRNVYKRYVVSAVLFISTRLYWKLIMIYAALHVNELCHTY